MIKDLAKLATRLDKLGLTKEADVLDAALNKLAQDAPIDPRKSGIFSSSGGEDPFAALSDTSLPADITAGVGKLKAPLPPSRQPGSAVLPVRSPTFGQGTIGKPGESDYAGGGKFSTPLSTAPAKPGIATEGRAEGLASNPWRGFLHASPRSIAEFNDTLTKMFEIVPRTSKLVPADVKSNLPKGQTTWTPQTQKAFGVIATLAGFPQAGKPGGWAGPDGKSGWSQANGYEPTMKGILKFWEDKKQIVIDKLISEWQATAAAESAKFQETGVKEEGDIPNIADPLMQTGPVTTPSKPKPSMTLESYERGQPESQAAGGGTGEVDLRPLKRRLYNKVTGGTGIQIGAEGQKFFSTFTGQVISRVEAAMGRSPAAKVWFSQDPSIILPDDAIRNKNVMSIYSGPSEEIKAVYQMIQDAFQAKRTQVEGFRPYGT